MISDIEKLKIFMAASKHFLALISSKDN